MPRPPANPTACRILENILAQPGIHFRGLKRAAQVTSAGQLRHHIDRLVRQGHIIEVGDGGFMRFFAAGAYDRRLRQQMTRFSRPIPRRVARLLLRGGMTRTHLRKALGCADSTLGYYLSRMHREGILYKKQEAASQHYALADPDSVRQVLQAQDASVTLPGQHRPTPPHEAAPRPERPARFEPHPRASATTS